MDKQIEEEKINEVLKDCELDGEIEKWEDKLETIVGEKGIKLSGGQKQRVAIARSLLKEKPIFIFDEAFSKLDETTRKNILNNLEKNYQEKTMLFLSNDLHIIKHVHKIIYLCKHTTYVGTHEELLEKNQDYQNLMKVKEYMI